MNHHPGQKPLTFQATDDAGRERVLVSGRVQGVGFRPFVFGLAQRLELAGFVRNVSGGVEIHIQGPETVRQMFKDHLQTSAPAGAVVENIQAEPVPLSQRSGFSVEISSVLPGSAGVTPVDVATCPDCLNDLNRVEDRRYRYPFTTCATCGPRDSIVRSLPYDRARTSMHEFPMCDACRGEYQDPENRRFHAESIACPECGPTLTYHSPTGDRLAVGEDALHLAEEMVRQGRVLALKGLGGFQLIVDATNPDAIDKLRERKHRPHKPFAVMVPSLAAAEQIADLADEERDLLTALEAPIVLVRCRADQQVLARDALAPDNAYIGLFLPHTPLHHLLLTDLKRPVVATSGNVSGEPIVTDGAEAFTRLRDIADGFLVHDRPIVRPLDDSVAQVVDGLPMLLRRARGYASVPVSASEDLPPILAVGGHLKSTVAVSNKDRVTISPYIGDLDTAKARAVHENAIERMTTTYTSQPEAAARDLHPDYHSSRVADESGLPVIPVQHHLAHVMACIAEHDIKGPMLGISWDGSGYGSDKTIWGGESLIVDSDAWQRFARLRPFRLPGGSQAMREPRRAAFGVLHEMKETPDGLLTERFGLSEQKALSAMLQNGLNAPFTSSVGRLFDATASLLDVCHTCTFEGQAAIALESLAHRAQHTPKLAGIKLEPTETEGVSWTLNWEPLMRDLIAAVRSRESIAGLAWAIHRTLAQAVADVAMKAEMETVVLTGGCFQNRILAEASIDLLRHNGFRVFWPQKVPPNDGGLALGQAAWAARVLNREQPVCA